MALTGTALAGSVAGCSDGGGDDGAASGDDGVSEDGSGDSSGETEVPETEAGQPDVVVVSEEMTDDTITDTEYAKVVEFEVENQGGARSGEVDVIVDWFDPSGEKTGDERRDIPFLPADTTWVSYVPSIYEFDDPGSYELELEVETELEEQPDVTVTEVTVEVGEDINGDSTVLAEAEAEYGGDTEIDYLTTKVVFYDEQGRVVWNTAEKETNVDPGDSLILSISAGGPDEVIQSIDDAEFVFRGSSL